MINDTKIMTCTCIILSLDHKLILGVSKLGLYELIMQFRWLSHVNYNSSFRSQSIKCNLCTMRNHGNACSVCCFKGTRTQTKVSSCKTYAHRSKWKRQNTWFSGRSALAVSRLVCHTSGISNTVLRDSFHLSPNVYFLTLKKRTREGGWYSTY